MQFKVGNKVRYLNEKGGGIITKIQNEIIWIKIEEGFEIPTNKNELIVIEEVKQEDIKPSVILKKEEQFENQIKDSELKNNSFKKVQSVDEIENEHNKLLSSYFIAFVLKDDKNWSSSDFDLYFINDSPFEIFYNIVTKFKHEYAQLESNNIESDTKCFITTIKRSDLNDLHELLVQVIAYKKGFYQPQTPFENRIKIKPAKYFKQHSFVENDFFEENAIIYQIGSEMQIKLDVDEIDKEELKKIIEKKEFFQPQTKKENSVNDKKDMPVIEEVDLHIEKIIPEYMGMSNTEMLITQISHFRSKLESAILRNVKKIVFIHGIGNGTLKHELRKILDEHYHDLKYQDASFKEYGYGATLVFVNK